MFYSLVAIGCAALLAPSSAFNGARVAPSRSAPMMTAVATEAAAIAQSESPDFYWQFRLDRLVSKKGADLSFAAKNYPDSISPKALYDAYYLDLTLQGKMENFDWSAEKEINDSEWQIIYKYICNWTKDVAKASSSAKLPENDFDLLKQFYPSVDMRDLETPFVESEVGQNFPYKNMKEMLGAASAGTLKVPKFEGVTSLDAVEAKKQLQILRPVLCLRWKQSMPILLLTPKTLFLMRLPRNTTKNSRLNLPVSLKAQRSGKSSVKTLIRKLMKWLNLLASKRMSITTTMITMCHPLSNLR
jgi:hypothetical protein